MTAVEWLAEQIKDYDFAPITNTDEYAIVIPVWIFKDKINQAKEMEKDLALRFGIKCQMDFIRSNKITHVEEIYNEAYGTHE